MRRAATLGLLVATAALAACEPRAERERRIQAEQEAAMLDQAAGDTLDEGAFQRDSAELAASLAVDTVEGGEFRTRTVYYTDPDDGSRQATLDTVYAVRGRHLGYCDDVTAGVASRPPGDTLTCQWRPSLDTATAVAVPPAP